MTKAHRVQQDPLVLQVHQDLLDHPVLQVLLVTKVALEALDYLVHRGNLDHRDFLVIEVLKVQQVLLVILDQPVPRDLQVFQVILVESDHLVHQDLMVRKDNLVLQEIKELRVRQDYQDH